MNASTPMRQAVASAPTAAQSRRNPWILIQGPLSFTLLTAVGFGLVVAGIVVSIAWRSNVTGSVWEAAANAVPWFAAVMGGHAFFQIVPMLIANGFTRRDASLHGLRVIGVTTLTITLLTTLGYLVEWIVYRWQDWPRGIGGNHFFTNHSQVGVIFWETLLTMALWSALGAMVGAAFYRYDQNGWFSLIPAGVVMVLVGVFMTTRTPVFDNVMDRFFSDWGRSLPLATLATAAGLALAGALLWRIVRDLPLRAWR